MSAQRIKKRRTRTCETAVISLDDVQREAHEEPTGAASATEPLLRAVASDEPVAVPITCDVWDDEPTVREPSTEMEALVVPLRRSA